MNIEKMIFKSLKNLLEIHSFEKITVQMILDDCEISRSSFYRHFKDKYEVMNWYYKTSVNEICKSTPKGDIKEFNLRILNFMLNNKEYFCKISNVDGFNSFWNFLYDYTMEFYCSVMNEDFTKITMKERMQFAFLSAGGAEVVRIWVKAGCKEPVEIVAETIIQSIPEEIRTKI